MLLPPAASIAVPNGLAGASSNPCTSPHCYSEIYYYDPTDSLTGLVFQEEDSNMYVASSASTGYHISSEGWYVEGNGGGIEVGLLSDYQGTSNWWLYPCNCDAYTQFWADTQGTKQWIHAIANISPDGAEHTYSISRGSSPDWYNIGLDGTTVGLSQNTNEWSGIEVEVGGEFYGPNPGWDGSFANTFDIFHKLYNTSNETSPIDWPGVSGISISPGFNGLLSNGNNTYSWNMTG